MNDEDSRNAEILTALQFFDGVPVVERTPGVPYADLTQGQFGMREQSKDEVTASRAAVRRLLLSGDPPKVLLERIAGVFAPDGEDAAPKKAYLKYRSASRPKNEILTLQLLIEVEALRANRQMTREQAIADVAERHGLTESKVRSHLDRGSKYSEKIRAAVQPKK